MKILFVHQNFPGQFGALARHLASDPDNTVFALRSPPGGSFPNVNVIPYQFLSVPLENQHPLLVEQEAKMLRAEAAAATAEKMKESGFYPDVIIAHSGWGEALFLKEVWPEARLIAYLEYFYREQGQDMGFDPEFSDLEHSHRRLLRWKNTANHLILEQADAAVAPTAWQRSTFPAGYQSMIEVIHDGIDTEFYAPDANASVTLAKSGRILTAKDEVITFAARFLEPIRGFHTFMRALPDILKKRPKAQILILGGMEPGYMDLPEGEISYKHMLLKELHQALDPQRVHFLGVLSPDSYRSVLQISSAHVYLTYPFVLSWSMLEAMSCGARIFASATPPVTEFVRDGENGTLFEFSPEALARSVCNGLRTNKATKRRAQARATVLDISRDKMLAHWTEKIRTTFI